MFGMLERQKIKICDNKDKPAMMRKVCKSKRFTVRLGRKRTKLYLPFTVKNSNGLTIIKPKINELVFKGPSASGKVFFFLGKMKVLELEGPPLLNGESLTISLPPDMLVIS